MYFEIHGDQHSETVLLSAGLGGSHHYWKSLIPELAQQFRVITYDHYGTGHSQGEIMAGYRVADMAAEVTELLSVTGTEKAHFIGHALGGLIGLQLAIDAPHQLASLIVVNGWEKTDEHTKRCFEIRKSLLQTSGAAMFFKAQPLFLYPAEWMKQHADELEAEAKQLMGSFSEANLLRRIAAAEAFDLSGQLAQIGCPTGVIASRDDLLVPYSCSEQLCGQIPQSTLYLMQSGGHACNITEPEAFQQILQQFYHRQ